MYLYPYDLYYSNKALVRRVQAVAARRGVDLTAQDTASVICRLRTLAGREAIELTDARLEAAMRDLDFWGAHQWGNYRLSFKGQDTWRITTVSGLEILTGSKARLMKLLHQQQMTDLLRATRTLDGQTDAWI